MHTRRVGAFLMGAWLLGSMLMWFAESQDMMNVERFFTNPPSQVAKELDDVGPQTMRQILRFQALQHTRHIAETWLVVQLGLGAALIATSLLTAHRSRMVLICSGVMFVMVTIMYFLLTPTLNALGRSFDFLPPTAALIERENFTRYAVWMRVLEILKIIVGIAVTGRLLFDRYDWMHNAFTNPSSSGHRLRRRKRGHAPQQPASPEPSAGPPAETGTI